MELLKDNPRPRRDPLKDPCDIDSMRLAREFWLNYKQGGYTAATIPRPLGIVPFEGLRQTLTFAVPLALLALIWIVLGAKAALYATPVAWLIGWLLDLWVTSDIEEKRAAEEAKDRGNYARVRSICTRLNLTPEELTAKRLHALALGWRVAYNRALADWEAHQRMLDTPNLFARMRADKAASLAAAGAAAGVAAVAMASYDDSSSTESFFPVYETPSYPEPSAYHVSPYGDVNPANGMPMIPDSPLDVTGHVYGTDGNPA